MSAKKRSEPEQETPAPSLAEVQAELETIISQLEDEETGLEQSIELYERGSRLVATASKVLAEAEQRVRVLTEGDDEPEDSDAID